MRQKIRDGQVFFSSTLAFRRLSRAILKATNLGREIIFFRGSNREKGSLSFQMPGLRGISDPGFRLIQKAIENHIPIVPIPGPSAVITALSVAGLPTDAFLFKGFLPHKAKKRRDLLQQLEPIRETLIFYESPYRISETLGDILSILGDREIVLARELTKAYEEILRGKVGEIQSQVAGRKLKGEITLVVSGKMRKMESQKSHAKRKDGT